MGAIGQTLRVLPTAVRCNRKPEGTVRKTASKRGFPWERCFVELLEMPTNNCPNRSKHSVVPFVR